MEILCTVPGCLQKALNTDRYSSMHETRDWLGRTEKQPWPSGWVAENDNVGLGKPIPPTEGSLFLSLATGPLTELGERFLSYL